jgi:putative ABC transport system permease protein
MFLRGRGASLLTVAMLAVAIAGTLTLYTVLTATTTLWPDLPERKQLARIYASNPRLGAERDAIPLASFTEWAPQLATLEAAAAFADDGRSVDDAPDIQAQVVSSRYFEVFQVLPIAGRSLDRTDHAAGRSAVLGERFARRKFGTSADAIGKSIGLGHDTFTVVGVMPGDFYFPTPSAQVWIPLRMIGSAERRVMGVGRLRPGRQWSEVAAELSAVAERGNGSASAIGWTLRPIPLDEDQQVRTRNGLIGLLGPALLVLLIACVNATNLMLSRGVERDSEFAVRWALGASRGRIVRQLLVEGAVVATIAAAAGATLSVWGIRIFRSLVAGFNSPMAERIAFTNATLLGAIVIAIATPIAVSALPALAASRRRTPATLSGVVGSGRAGSGYGPRDILVFAEMALASVLVVMALMVFRLYGELQSIRPSYDPEPVAVASIEAVSATNLAALVERARAVPGVVAVATIKGPLLPIDRAARGVVSVSGNEIPVPCSVAEISPDYFRTLQLPIVLGRSFANDMGPASGVAIASVTLAERLWGSRGLPADRVTLTVGARTRQLEIIGIAADALAPNRLLEASGGSLYLPSDPTTAGPANLLARASGAADSVVEPLSQAVSDRAGTHPVRVRPLADVVGDNPRDTVLVSGLLAMFSTLALILAAGGVFAVTRHAVLQRTREFGIRLALGATSKGLIRTVVSHEMKLVGVGVAVAAGGTLAVTYFTFIEMWRLAVSDPFFWTGLLLALAGVSTIACYAAARRISRLEPIDALRDL